MNLEFTKVDKGWRVDCLDCPGTPPVGHGKTKVQALACLIYVLNFSQTGGPNSSNWMKYIKAGEPITINGKKWRGIY